MPSDDPFQFSRRKFLQGSAALAAVSHPNLALIRSKFKLTAGKNWIKVHRDETLAFELRSEWFAGQASVWGEQSGNQIAFGVMNSRHNGLDLIADATFDLWEDQFGTQAEVRYPGLGLKFAGYAEEWLSDVGIHSFLPSAVTLLDSEKIRLVAARGPVKLAANGTLHFKGKSLAEVHEYGIVVGSKSMLLIGPSAESAGANPKPKSIFALHRGIEPWHLDLPRGDWRYVDTGGIFDTALIETFEQDPVPTQRLVFWGQDHAKSFRIAADVLPSGTDGRPIDLTFVEPRYAIDLKQKSRKFEAQLAEAQSMQFGPLRLMLTPPSTKPALQADDQGCSVCAQAGLVGNIDTALIAPTDDLDPWDVAVLTDSNKAASYAQASVAMAGTNPVLKGALRFRILRPQDALDICFRITNIALTIDPPPLGRLQLAHNADDPNDYSLLIADLSPQVLIMPGIKSSAMTDTDDCKTNCIPPKISQSRLASPSRVSMRFLSSDDPNVILSLETLLEWARYPLQIAPAALQKPGSNSDPLKIPESATEIIAPAGLSISPDENHAFFSSAGVRFNDKVTQQWTARLSKRIEPQSETSAENSLTHFPVTPERRPSLRPLLAHKLDDSDDYTLHNDDLALIVKMMEQRSAPARHCVLSSNGAWLDFGDRWPVLGNPDAHNRSAFRETIAGLLEQKVEFVMEAWLAPTGHRVSVVRSGMLQWCREQDKKGDSLLVARFVEHYKIIYHLPTKIEYDFLRKDPKTQKDVRLPFRSIELIGNETPYLEYSKADAFFKDCGTKNPSVYDYWAWVSPDPAKPPVPFEFPVEIVDRADVKHRTTMKMVLACYEQATDSQNQGSSYFYNGAIANGYNNPSFDPSVELMQRRVAYARPTQMGNTSYPTRRIRLIAHTVPDLGAAKHNETIPWWPQMETTDLTLEQVAAFTKPSNGSKAGEVTLTFEFAKVYKDVPFDDISDPKGENRAEVILSLAANPQTKKPAAPVQMDFNAGLGGGLAMPSTNIVALARKTGTVFSHIPDLNNLDATLQSIGKKGMTVAEMFKDLGRATTLLGAVDIAEVLEEVSDGVAQASQVPLLAVKQLHELEQATIGKVNDLLKPVLDFAKQAETFYSTCTTQIENLRQQLPIAIQTASSLLRVIATEQRPTDIGILERQTFDSTLRGLSTRLAARVALSPLQRIQIAAKWPPVDENNQPILPTLYQARDYALYSLLGKPAEDIAKKLDDALLADEAQLQQDLDYAYALAGQVVGTLAGTLIGKFVYAVRSLVAGITTADVQNAITAFETVADIAAAIPTLNDAAANLRQGIQDSLGKTAGACTVLQLHKRAKALSDAVAQLGSAIPVGAEITKALASGGLVEMACDQVLKRVTDTVSTAKTIVDTILATEEQFRQAFLQQQQQILDALQYVRDLLTIPKHVNIHYTYATPLKNSDSGLFIAEFDGKRSQFTLDSRVLINLDGTPPQFDIQAEVTNFRLKLIPAFPFVMIGFSTARFESHNGGSPTVSCPFDAKNVQLIGPLDFVAELSKKLDLPDGLVVQITGAGVQVGMNIHLPAITCGAFNIVNLSVYTAVKLYFDGGPLTVIFGFANPNQHFTMTYLFLGGGGFVNLEFAPWATTAAPGMAVTAALEGGAMAALDFGVAHGEVHIFAGMYMSLRPADLLLSGYFRAGGEFDVLGLISASIEFLMALSYENRGGEAWLSGDCEVDIDVHVLFFSETVTLHMHHDFSGR